MVLLQFHWNLSPIEAVKINQRKDFLRIFVCSLSAICKLFLVGCFLERIIFGCPHILFIVKINFCIALSCLKFSTEIVSKFISKLTSFKFGNFLNKFIGKGTRVPYFRMKKLVILPGCDVSGTTTMFTSTCLMILSFTIWVFVVKYRDQRWSIVNSDVCVISYVYNVVNLTAQM